MRTAFLAFILATVASCAFAQEKFQFGTEINPDGHTIEVDRYGLVIDGHHIIPVMGEMHYSRVPSHEWRREIRKMKAGGITILSTYVFWIHHEEQEGVWNWNGNLNLHRFLEICAEESMPVVLRVGPFCHGEVYLGGLPEWLVKKAHDAPQMYRLRSEAPGFLAETYRFYSNIYAQVCDLMWKNGGTVIGMQIENECRGPWSYYMKLKAMALQIGFDLPFYTRTGWPKLNGKEEFGHLLPLYGDYADGFWDRALVDMPGEYSKGFTMRNTRESGVIATETFTKAELSGDNETSSGKLHYPYLTCELGGGMMPSYHRRINISGKEILPLAICKLGSGSNLLGYYMYHGGTNPYNPRHTMGETQASEVTNYNDMPYMMYDFQAPLGEMGQLNETAFHESRWLHQFLSDWGQELALYDVDTLSDNYARRGCFEFRNNYVRINYEDGCASVTPIGMVWEGMEFTSSTIQPFAKADGGLYFIPVKNAKKYRLEIDGKCYNLKLDKTIHLQDKQITLLSYEKAKKAFVIDGKMQYARHGGILYRDGDRIVEESWEECDDISVSCSKVKEHDGLREVKIGRQKVATMPVESDFDKAAIWSLDVYSGAFPPTHKMLAVDQWSSVFENPDSYYLEITYRGDVARVYANGQLVEDNFWNGKPMLVRLSDLLGKTAELRILPLDEKYPIYLQKDQREQFNAVADGILCEVTTVRIIKKHVI